MFVRCAVVAVAGWLLVGAVNADSPTAEGFVSLFNGKDLSGWVKEGNCGFSVQDGVIYCDATGDYPTWLRTEGTYENFVLRLEFQTRRHGEGGVFLHAPKHGRNSKVGFEIQLSDDTRNAIPAVISTGAIFGAVPPIRHNTNKLGDWNQVEITFDWPMLRVVLNGEIVQELNVEQNPELRYRLRNGYLGLQDRQRKTWYRNIYVKKLPDSKAEQEWKPLFNGTDFTGWNMEQKGDAKWKIEDGAIVAEDGNGYVLTNEAYENYELRTYIKATPYVNGGIFLRWNKPVDDERGYEIQIEDVPDSNNPTGSIYDIVRALDPPLRGNEWYLMQIFLQNNHCVIRVDGQTVVDTDKLSLVRPGPIALQMHKTKGSIAFKDIAIRPLGEPCCYPRRKAGGSAIESVQTSPAPVKPGSE